MSENGGQDRRNPAGTVEERADNRCPCPAPSEGIGNACQDTIFGLRLQPVHLVDDRHAERRETRETGVRHAQSRREQQNVAAGVWIEDVGGFVLAVPLAVEFEHRVDGPGRRGGDLLERMGVAVRHRPVQQRGLRERGVLEARLGADQPVGHRAVVLEAAAELGVLRAATRDGSEQVRVERPGSEALRERGAEQQVGRAGARLEFGLEQQALRVDPVGRAGRQLDAEQERRLGARRDAVDEAILPEQRGVGEPGGIAAIVDRVADDAARQVRVMALADVGAMHIGDAHRDHEVVGDAIGGTSRGALRRVRCCGRGCAGSRPRSAPHRRARRSGCTRRRTRPRHDRLPGW